MNELLDKLKSLSIGQINPGVLAEIVNSIDFSELTYKEHVKFSEHQDYTRIQLMAEPFDVELMLWPPAKQSAIHMHAGFWGHVIVLEGKGIEIAYSWNGNKLSYLQETILTPGANMHVQQNSVHSVMNASGKEIFITLHIYYPSQAGMENTLIFDIDGNRLGVLNKRAKSASWNEPATGFDSILSNAFEFEGKRN